MTSTQPKSLDISYILVTGATGFVGAHVVDTLLLRGLRVRGATRSLNKGQAMLDARPRYADRLDFVQIADFEGIGEEDSAIWDKALAGVDGVIHVASPLRYDTTNNEKELILPAIYGVKSLMKACLGTSVRRVVLTSSFASVLNAERSAEAQKTGPYFEYTSDDWNPLTYAEAIDPKTSAVIAYRGSKTFAERAAWDFIQDRTSYGEPPPFELITLCPPMAFGPVSHPVTRASELNESNAMLWAVASGAELPVARVPFWVDVRDLAAAHVESLLRLDTGMKRFVVASPERFTYGLAASIMHEEFGEWATQVGVRKEDQILDKSYGLNGSDASSCLGFEYRTFRESVVDLVKQVQQLEADSVRKA